tara:strand:- start:48 stop:203 length:156 start_codon:yes stop_codon:yes gene_type:complete
VELLEVVWIEMKCCHSALLNASMQKEKESGLRAFNKSYTKTAMSVKLSKEN